MKFSKESRSNQSEIIDNFEFQGEEMQNLLQDLKFINIWLGGNKATLKGLDSLLKNHSLTQEIVVVDIGCGNGSTLRNCADYAQKSNIKLKGIGIDFNNHILKEALIKSSSYSNLTYQNINVIQEKNRIPHFDIAICNLFLHHLGDHEIEILLTYLIQKSNIGLIINDLHRSRPAFDLFKMISFLFLKTETAAHDGLISIAKGFRKQELINFSQNIPNQTSQISWQWAFRYLWILKKEVISL